MDAETLFLFQFIELSGFTRVCLRKKSLFIFFYKEQLFELIPIAMTIFFLEFFIDWVKLAFVLKFNDISAEVINFLSESFFQPTMPYLKCIFLSL